MSKPKIAIIGAGSAQFSAEIVRDLCVNRGLRGSHVVLMDIDGQRLKMVLALAELLTREIDGQLTFATTTSREEALRGADFVINTAQAGGHSWVEAQRTLAEKHGYYRGAHLHDFGQMELFLDVARDVERICPNAWLIQSANPVLEGCTLMHRETKLKVLGLCHGHYGYFDIVRVLGLEREQVTAQMKGFNHWIWMTDFRYRGVNAYPLIDEWIQTKAESYWQEEPRDFADTQMCRGAIDQYQRFGLMPIGDTPRFVGWWYHTDLTTKKNWFRHLGGFDSEIGWAKYLDYVEDNLKKIDAALTAGRVTEIFPPKQGLEQIVPIINSLVNDDQSVYQVNIPNTGGLVQGFPENLVVECQGIVNGAGIHGVMTPPLPDKIVVGEMIPRWRRAECAVKAIQTRDPEYLLQYLLYDQRTQTEDQAKRLLDAWFTDPRNARLAHLFGRN